MLRFNSRGFGKRFARRASDDEKHNNRQRPNRKQKRGDRSSKKRNICIQCKKCRALTNLVGWAKQCCTKCARDTGCSFPQDYYASVRRKKMKGNEEKMEDGEDARKNGERKTNGSRKVVKHGQANSRKAVENKVKGVEMVGWAARGGVGR